MEMAGQVVELIRRTPVPESGSLFKVRYCEILLPFLEDGGIMATVYGTQQLNDCPQDAWDAIDPTAIAAEYGALLASKNGPRYWVLDEIEIGEGGFDADPPEGFGQVFLFGDLEMRLLTTVVPPVDEGSNAANPYSIARVDRNTISTFAAGRRVYQLQDPEGERYIMQSFCQIVDPDLQLHELARL